MRNTPLFFARQIGPKFGNVTRNVYKFRMSGGNIPARAQSVEPRSGLLKLRVCNETGYTTTLGQGKKFIEVLVQWPFTEWSRGRWSQSEEVLQAYVLAVRTSTAKSFYTSDIS